jgi:hypothetical protein
MATRLTSSLSTFTSASWTPTSDVVLQLDGAPLGSTVAVTVYARNSAGAAWQPVASMSPSNPIAKVAQVPFMELVMSGNSALNAISVLDNT